MAAKTTSSSHPSAGYTYAGITLLRIGSNSKKQNEMPYEAGRDVDDSF